MFGVTESMQELGRKKDILDQVHEVFGASMPSYAYFWLQKELGKVERDIERLQGVEHQMFVGEQVEEEVNA